MNISTIIIASICIAILTLLLVATNYLGHIVELLKEQNKKLDK